MPRNASSAVLRNIRKLAAAPGDARRTDRDLLRRFAERHDEAAFEALVARHGSMVLSVCRRVLHTAHDAEDAWQATFLILARKAGTQRWQESVANWLYKTAYQTALRARTAAGRRAKHEKQTPAREAVHPLAEMTGQELLAALDEELLKLPERDRAPLVLCYLEGLTRDEAARHLGCPLGTLKSRLERGRDRLHTALVRRGLGLSAGLAAVALAPAASRALVPAGLLGPTVQAAQLLAAGKPAAEVLAAPVCQLLKGELGPMMLTKTKALLAVLLAAGVLSGAGVLTYRAQADRSAGEPSQGSARPVAGADVLPHQDEAQADPLLATDHLPEQDEAQAAAPPAPPGQDVPGAKPVENLPETVALGGRVLDRDGKPVARARVRVFASAAESRRVAPGIPTPPPPRVTVGATVAVGKLLAEADAGSDGRFKLLVPRQALEDGVKVVATAAGRGPDWLDLSAAATDVTLRLPPDDVPLEGRVLDLETRPVAEAHVTIASLGRSSTGDLKAWLDAGQPVMPGGVGGGGMPGFGGAANMASTGPAPLKVLAGEALAGLPAAVTDKEGRFRLDGVGRDTVVTLLLRGDGLATGTVRAVTRTAKDAVKLPSSIHAARFDVLLGPGKEINGTVTEKATGKPLAGVRVDAGGSGWWTTTTDDRGRYRILGVPKRPEHQVFVGRADCFSARKQALDTADLDPVTIDVELVRGLPLGGRVLDKATGKPVMATLDYFSLPDNPHLKDLDAADLRGIFTTRPDGSFQVLGIPGPGYLAVSASDDNRFTRAEIKDWDGNPLPAVPRPVLPYDYHAVVRVEPSEADAPSRSFDITLDPGVTRRGTLVGPDGKPVTGAFAFGLTATTARARFGEPVLRGLTGADFTAVGVNPREPRYLVFVHPEKKLGKVQQVRGDEPGPLTVTLEPLGAVSGRLLDADGKPVQRLTITAFPTRKMAEYKEYPVDLLYRGGARNARRTQERNWRPDPVKSDAEGKFHVDRLIPGLKYELLFTDAEFGAGVGSARPPLGVTVAAGEAKDLGDLKHEKDSPKPPKPEEE